MNYLLLYDTFKLSLIYKFTQTWNSALSDSPNALLHSNKDWRRKTIFKIEMIIISLLCVTLVCYVINSQL